jgi:disulfide bond formation protein DsbB
MPNDARSREADMATARQDWQRGYRGGAGRGGGRLGAHAAAYGSGASVMTIATAVILVALGFEHIGGYVPCPLCLQQRYAYYVGIPLAFVALVLLSLDRPRLAGLTLFVVALAFLANAGLGGYHAGAEWKWWPGPSTCGAVQPIGGSGGGGLLDTLAKPVRVIRCDEAPWTFAGLSFAGWNVVASLGLFALALKAAFEAAGPGPARPT